MRAALLAALLLACGHPPRGPAVAPAGPAAVSLAAAAPLVTPGERMTFRMQLRGVELAAMTLAVGEITELDGHEVIMVQSHAHSVGLANLVAAVDDTFTSWIDVATGRTHRFTVAEFETGSRTNIEHTVAHIGQRAGTTIPVEFALNDAAPRPEPQAVSHADIWDFNTFLIALRSWEGRPGTRTSMEAFRSRWMWQLDVTIGARETLSTELGEMPALRFDAHGFRLQRTGQRDLSSETRAFSIWISDDDGRVPLKVKAKTDYGDVTLDIVDYQPGTGARLRRR